MRLGSAMKMGVACLLGLQLFVVWRYLQAKEAKKVQPANKDRPAGDHNPKQLRPKLEGFDDQPKRDGNGIPDLGTGKGYVKVGGSRMDVIGYGTAGLGGRTKEAVAAAIEAGYRHLDTAMAREWYRDDLVGEAVQASGVARDELFITTKLHPKDLGTETTKTKVEDALKALKTPYIDLMLIHYPECFGNLCSGKEPEGTWRDSWRVMESFVASGKIRAIGVSNFNTQELARLLTFARIRPTVVQSHSDPLEPNTGLRRLCARSGILFVAYSTLGTQHVMRSKDNSNPVLTHPTITRIAAAHNVGAAVVTLRWALHSNMVVIPRSSQPDHMAANLKAAALSLSDEEYAAIDAIAAGGRS